MSRPSSLFLVWGGFSFRLTLLFWIKQACLQQLRWNTGSSRLWLNTFALRSWSWGRWPPLSSFRSSFLLRTSFVVLMNCHSASRLFVWQPVVLCLSFTSFFGGIVTLNYLQRARTCCLRLGFLGSETRWWSFSSTSVDFVEGVHQNQPNDFRSESLSL